MTDVQLFAFVILPIIIAVLGWVAAIAARHGDAN
jgi:hypothetical protein